MKQLDDMAYNKLLREIAAHRLGIEGYPKMTNRELRVHFTLTEWDLRTILESERFATTRDELLAQVAREGLRQMAAEAGKLHAKIISTLVEVLDQEKAPMARVAAAKELREIMGQATTDTGADDRDRLIQFLMENQTPQFVQNNANFYHESPKIDRKLTIDVDPVPQPPVPDDS
jgi:hypothetical protein